MIILTEAAADEIKKVMKDKDLVDNVLRIGVKGGGCSGFQYSLGFDTETKPAYRKGGSHPPALLQLASKNDVFVFQLKYLRLPKSLRKIFANPNIIKAGVSLHYDISELTKLARFKPAGFVDLGKLAKEIGMKNHGLRGLAAVVLGFRIPKTACKSNWARNTLTPAQIKYAATDAWIGRELYKKIRHKSSVRS